MAKKEVVAGIEIIDDTPTVDPVSQVVDFRELAASEAFMNEMVEVMVHASTDENQSPHVILNCNGTNQPIMRGVPMRVRRTYEGNQIQPSNSQPSSA